MRQDLSGMSILGLLSTYSSVIRELCNREVVRSSNSPVGDYAEYLVKQALGLDLTKKSSAGCDANGPDGTRYEIKARRLATGSRANRFSAIRQLDANHFDLLIAVVFREDFTVDRAVQISHGDVKRFCFWQQHVNAWILPIHDSVWNDPEVIDITASLAAVQGR